LAPNNALLADADERARPGAPVVEILSADKVFPNGTRALAAIDLTIAAGEFLTLIGPSGCGKSTLLKLIANLIEPTDGRILWWSGAFDKVATGGRSIAFVFQRGGERASSARSCPHAGRGKPPARQGSTVACGS
jgi:NitT/TauT family transport system ATP-binding protein